jgi:hypothetical protein
LSADFTETDSGRFEIVFAQMATRTADYDRSGSFDPAQSRRLMSSFHHAMNAMWALRGNASRRSQKNKNHFLTRFP